MPIYGYTQHAGLAENVLDHRLNCRTVYMNPLHRYLYWNMNYHVEHHMFPLVPYHALPRLHELVKADMPRALSAASSRPGANCCRPSCGSARTRRTTSSGSCRRPRRRATTRSSPRRPRPTPTAGSKSATRTCLAARTCCVLTAAGRPTPSIAAATGRLFATDGICTHGNTHLADGLVKGDVIECPKHNGRYHLADGSPARAPVCRGLCTYPVESRGGRLFLNVLRAGGAGARAPKKLALRVVSNRNVATFIKELVVEPVDERRQGRLHAGRLSAIRHSGLRRDPLPRFRHAAALRRRLGGAARLRPGRPQSRRRPAQQLFASPRNPDTEAIFRFNVRIATPPPGQDCPPGAGSAYMFSLKPGDMVTAIGPYGDFHIKPTQKEMVYIGGGSGMAPLRSHLSHLLETEHSGRRISFWYGARSRQELFYQDYFEQLAAEHPTSTSTRPSPRRCRKTTGPAPAA